MNLYFVTEGRFFKHDSKYYSEGTLTKALWNRYLSKFDKITVVARVMNVSTTQLINERMRSDTDKVDFIELPYYIGPIEFIFKYHRILRVMQNNFRKGNAYILRVPGPIGTIAANVLRRRKIPYAVEVVGDPYDVFDKPGIFYKFLRYTESRHLRNTVFHAESSLYVTEKALQKRYPNRPGTFTTNASNVILNDNLIVEKADYEISQPINLVSVGSLSQMYKSPDVVLLSIKCLVEKGYDINLRWVGDGRYRKSMEEMALNLNIADRVTFVGQLPPGECVIKELDNCSIFLLVSKTEGLPRALIEAMSRGKFCIATNVGGIPELLDDEWLIEPGSVEQLTGAIEKVINNPTIISKQITINLRKVKKYTQCVLQNKRELFYTSICTPPQKKIKNQK